ATCSSARLRNSAISFIEGESGGAHAPAKLPVEGGPGIRLASGRDVRMTDQRCVPQRRVLGAKRVYEPGERGVLGGLVRNVVGAFELHAYRKVVAAGSPEVLRL